jgi:hypothetical protein
LSAREGRKNVFDGFFHFFVTFLIDPFVNLT